jgi:tight adherence protein C
MQQLLAQFGDVNWQILAISASAMAAVVAAAVGFRAAFAPARDEVIDRLDRVISRGEPEPEQRMRGVGSDVPPSLWARFLRPLLALVRPTRADELSRLRSSLFQAGLRSDHAMELFLASKVLLAAGLTLVFLQINTRVVSPLGSPYDVAVAVWLSAAGFLLPNLWLASKVKARRTTIEQSLPDAMDLLVTCVEAGLGLDAALARVADEMRVAAPILAAELNLTFLEIQASITRRDAFRRLSERTGVDDLRQLSAVLTQTELFGTSISRALRVHADGMRIRRMQRAEEKAAMVGVKMTIPLIVCILPSLMAIVLGPAALAILQRFVNEGK